MSSKPTAIQALARNLPGNISDGDKHSPCPTCGGLIFYSYISIGPVTCAECNPPDRRRCRFLGMVVDLDGGGATIINLRQAKENHRTESMGDLPGHVQPVVEEDGFVQEVVERDGVKFDVIRKKAGNA